MAIVDVQKEIVAKKLYLDELLGLKDVTQPIDWNKFSIHINSLIDEEINKVKAEIDKMEFSIVQEDKNCELCSWSSSHIGVIICQCFASKHNGTFVQKNYANKCKLFSKD